MFDNRETRSRAVCFLNQGVNNTPIYSMSCAWARHQLEVLQGVSLRALRPVTVARAAIGVSHFDCLRPNSNGSNTSRPSLDVASSCTRIAQSHSLSGPSNSFDDSHILNESCAVVGFQERLLSLQTRSPLGNDHTRRASQLAAPRPWPGPRASHLTAISDIFLFLLPVPPPSGISPGDC